MINHFPVWKNLTIAITLVIAVIYALPNLYGEDPSVQISPLRGAVINTALLNEVKNQLEENDIALLNSELTDSQILLRFNQTEAQLKAVDMIKSTLGSRYVVALNLAPATPQWLRSLNAAPMYLGLDLRGGVHFLLEVDVKAAKKQAIDRSATSFRQFLRENKLRYLNVMADTQVIRIKFRNQSISY